MRPRYLRIVLTPRCTLACGFCHMEGDPGRGSGSSRELVVDAILAAHQNGVRKLKFLGGEPLLRGDLPDIIRAVRHLDLDISLITGGVGKPGLLGAAFDAGLDRANISIHGWSEQAFRARTGRGRAAWERRNATLAVLVERGRELKLNYVYTGSGDEDDLAEFLSEASYLEATVAVLDDLGHPDLDHAAALNVLVALRGMPLARWIEEDPNSLSTLRLRWSDGLVVELKDQQLGQAAPWSACGACPVRARCREGIHALRLGHDGRLRACMDRSDLSVDLSAAWTNAGRDGLDRLVGEFLDANVRRPA
ncbi:MAG: radical SAM protein [Proteobacteria bacterium]|nr:radical SAM protein [Pseudomonadota bacterium]